MPYMRALQLDDEKAMEDLFCEILASAKSTNAPLSFVDSSAAQMTSIESGTSGEGVNEKAEEAKGEEQKG